MNTPEDFPSLADDHNRPPIACKAGAWLTAGVGGCFTKVAGETFALDVLNKYGERIEENACRQAGRCLLQLPDPAPESLKGTYPQSHRS